MITDHFDVFMTAHCLTNNLLEGIVVAS